MSYQITISNISNIYEGLAQHRTQHRNTNTQNMRPVSIKNVQNVGLIFIEEVKRLW